MSETQDIEHIADLLRANEEIERLRTLLSDAVAALEEAVEALDNYADADMNPVGVVFGNTAMKALVEVQATLSKIKGAA